MMRPYRSSGTIASSAPSSGGLPTGLPSSHGAEASSTGPRPEIPLDLRGTAFQIIVWRFLLTIPRGRVVGFEVNFNFQ